MKDVQKFVGLDTSKDTIAVAIADSGRGEPRFHSTIQNKPENIRKLMKKLGDPENLLVCYEAGTTGYGIYRLLLSMGIECMVVAPTLIPKRSGDRVKTDKRDSIRLARYFVLGFWCKNKIKENKAYIFLTESYLMLQVQTIDG